MVVRRSSGLKDHETTRVVTTGRTADDRPYPERNNCVGEFAAVEAPSLEVGSRRGHLDRLTFRCDQRLRELTSDPTMGSIAHLDEPMPTARAQNFEGWHPPLSSPSPLAKKIQDRGTSYKEAARLWVNLSQTRPPTS